jgi:DUF4097 and DUF4098 domain-containing protein YvlB
MKTDTLYYAAAAALAVAWLLTPCQTHAARGRNFNININSGDAESCAGLKVSSNDGGQIAQVNESFTLRRGEASLLELNAAERGHITVRGWDRGEYSVETCKIAAADTSANADQIVRGISVSHSAGRLSFNGPTTDNAEWLVYFIVHAPKDAGLDLETRNGPIAVRDMNSTIKLRASNGPIAIRDCTGNIEAHTINGPIAFSGGGGDVHLTAQNGPIALNLANDTWNGNQLEAHTINGPLALAVPDTFLSGLRVETSGHTPMSCSAALCRNAWTDAGRNSRVLQMNGSSGTVRVTTENGPVSIHSSKKAKGTII